MIMKYIIEGEEKFLDNVVREQRIRIARGQVKVSPASDLSEEEVESLRSELQNKDLRIAELENQLAAYDKKDVVESDNKDVVMDDSKDIPADEKSVEVVEEKKPRKNKSKE